MDKKEVTIAKAFSIRKQIKKAIKDLDIEDILDNYTASITVTEDAPNKGINFDLDEFQKVVYEKKHKEFDNKTYTEILAEYESLQDELERLNVAIESASEKQRELLVKKTALADKLNLVSSLLRMERSYKSLVESETTKATEVNKDGVKSYITLKQNTYTVPRYDKNAELVNREITLKKEINKVNDQITYLDHTTKIDVSFLSDIWV